MTTHTFPTTTHPSTRPVRLPKLRTMVSVATLAAAGVGIGVLVHQVTSSETRTSVPATSTVDGAVFGPTAVVAGQRAALDVGGALFGETAQIAGQRAAADEGSVLFGPLAQIAEQRGAPDWATVVFGAGWPA